MKLDTNIYYIFSLVLLVLSFSRSSKSDSYVLPVCPRINCVQGTCTESNTSSWGFECDCYSGWTKYEILPLCIVPNCTLNSGCGTGAPASPPPSALLPSSDLLDWKLDLDPCGLTWCGEPGDGSCKRNGFWFECDCNDGADNLLDNSILPCFKECALGADCNGVEVGKQPTSVSDSPQAPSSHGLRELRRGSKIEDGLKILLSLAVVFHQWI